MAYDKTKLLHVTGGVSTLQHSFEYFSDDTVTTAGYFPKNGEVKDGDYVVVVKIVRENGVISSYSRTAYYAKADTAGVLTLTAVA